MFNKKFLTHFSLSLVGFYFVSAKAGFYPAYPRFDIVTHFLGGMAAAIFFTIIFERELLKTDLFFAALFILASTAFAGVVWEFFEWWMDHYLMPMIPNMRISQFSLNDTLGDLFVDMLGGLTVAAAFLSSRRLKKRI